MPFAPTSHLPGASTSPPLFRNDEAPLFGPWFVGILGRPGMHELRERLLMIERALDAGEYRPGRWTAFLRAARAQSRPVRQALAEDVSRVSMKLHRRHPIRTCAVGTAVGIEVAATVAGGALLWLGLVTASNAAAIMAVVIWITTFEPLLKVTVGLLLGVRYDYAYLGGIEPRFKMRYGTYLAASRPVRILLHLSGCVGSPLAAWVVGRLARVRLPVAASVATGFFWTIVAVNAGLFLAGLAGVERVGTFRVSLSSGGTAGAELHEGLASRS